MSMNYRQPLYRPPSEAKSLIFQIAYSCPHNTCSFCGMFKGVKYQRRDMDEVMTEIEWASQSYPTTKRVFLADGDVMFLTFDQLEIILEALNRCFPHLARINTYANGSSIQRKTKGELQRLRELKLNTLYMGLETGDDELLELVEKKETTEAMIEAVNRTQELGFKCSVMALLGLGGQERSKRHAIKTAEVLSRMNPRFLATLRFIEVQNTQMFDGYQGLTEYQAVAELKMIIERLELSGTVFTANHASNPVPLKGRLPTDKARLLAEIDGMLDSGTLDGDGPGYVPMWL